MSYKMSYKNKIEGEKGYKKWSSLRSKNNWRASRIDSRTISFSQYLDLLSHPNITILPVPYNKNLQNKIGRILQKRSMKNGRFKSQRFFVILNTDPMSWLQIYLIAKKIPDCKQKRNRLQKNLTTACLLAR